MRPGVPPVLQGRDASQDTGGGAVGPQPTGPGTGDAGSLVDGANPNPMLDAHTDAAHPATPDDAGAPNRADSAAGAGADAASEAGTTPDGAADTPVCPETRYATGNNAESLMHDGRMRRFDVYVPSTLPVADAAPLVLDFHGSTSSAAAEARGSGWKVKADAEGFVVVFPEGVGAGWNVGSCCGEALEENVDDVGFARAMVAAVSERACIDPRRVYATGISNGGGLAHRLACEAADVFAAIAAASADLVTDPCTPSRPIAELSVRGESDRLVAYEGGNTGSTGWYSPGAKGTLDLWKEINGCTGAPKNTLEYCETYDTCEAGVEVTLCSLPRTGHILYDNSLGFDVAGAAWEMFERQTLPR